MELSQSFVFTHLEYLIAERVGPVDPVYSRNVACWFVINNLALSWGRSDLYQRGCATGGLLPMDDTEGAYQK
jgi:hypothetical protein